MPGSRVYIIKATQPSGDVTFKVGTSMDVPSRLRGLQTASPFPLRLVADWGGGRQTEAALHQRLSAFALTGEWFSGDAQALIDEFCRTGVENIDGDLTPKTFRDYEPVYPTDPLPALVNRLAAVIESLQARLDEVQSDVALLRADLDRHTGREGDLAADKEIESLSARLRALDLGRPAECVD